jgi:glycosyltransferase involved in cell wall biosynthesis
VQAGGTVGLITETISPYRIPVFNALSERLDGRLRVFFLSERARRLWPVYHREIRFDYEVLPGLTMQPRGPGSQVLYANFPVFGRLVRAGVGPVIVGGYNHLEFVWALLYARLRRSPLILWSESVSAAEGGPRLRTAVKRVIARSCDCWVVPGARAARQAEALGAIDGRVFIAPNAVEVSFWGAEARERSPSGDVRLLFVGNLVPKKGLDVLLEALADDRLRTVPLEVAGVGRAAEALHETARARRLAVRFLGHLDREALRDRYRSADIFVFPTRADVWGLVLNEAMVAGCVPVTTWAAGASGDLVQDDLTGVVIPPDDPAALRRALVALIDDPDRRRRLAGAARARALEYTPERCADGFVRALEAVA